MNQLQTQILTILDNKTAPIALKELLVDLTISNKYDVLDDLWFLAANGHVKFEENWTLSRAQDGAYF